MTKKLKSGPARPAAKHVSKKPTSKAADAKAKKTTVKVKAKEAKPLKTKADPARTAVAKRMPTTAKTKAKIEAAEAKAAGAGGTTKRAAKTKLKIEPVYPAGEPILDPIGDTTDGEGRKYTGDVTSLAEAEMEAFKAETELEAQDGIFEGGPGAAAAKVATEEHERKEAEEAVDRESGRGNENAGDRGERPAGKLERLQKILSQAGIASRRHAEEMITGGRVMVNGQVVTTLGSKADITRDHIRVDGKLLKGVERHRYFVLNKPKGYVTTVSDPEGRPTVMEFFTKMGERLYPVGRLDYLSEGLLLMTNDGELANLLTKAGSGVEKTYLVKVAGQPSEGELERLRGGVEIERGEEGSARVRTSPARVRQVREGDNPWYEVVLIEGRNRELRKMFSAVGHFVEKIRRVGYGPLVLDVEPGKLRELTAEEVAKLRLTAEGKMKPRRVKTPSMLPKDAGRAAEARTRGGRPASGEGRPPFRSGAAAGRGAGGGDRSFKQRDDRPAKARWQPRESGGEKRPEFSRGDRPSGGREFQHGGRPSFGKPGEGRPGGRPGFGGPRTERPVGARSFGGAKPRFERPGSGRSFSDAKPRFDRARPAGGPSRDGAPGFGGPRTERPDGARSFGGAKPRFERPGGGRNFSDAKPRFDRPGGGRNFTGAKPRFDRPGFTGGPPRERTESGSGERPRRPFVAPGGRPPFKKFGESKGRFERAPSGGSRGGKPWTGGPRTAPAAEGGASGSAPGARFEQRGGFRKPGGFSKPGGFAKPGGKGGPYRGKPGGGNRGGSYRPGGRPSGGKRG
jgi:23S rRNA pseudouridine2605 synthase